MELATAESKLNLAGFLMFGENPENICPQFMMKAIRYPGNKIHIDSYLDAQRLFCERNDQNICLRQ